MPRALAALAVLVAGALVAAGCGSGGSGDSEGADSSSRTTPTTRPPEVDTATTGTIELTLQEGFGCDPLDERECLLPFPSDAYTVVDPATPTGRRVSFTAESMPTNKDGVPIDPTAWNRNDGFSPGTPILVSLPGLDPQRSGVAPETDIGASLDDDAPIVLLDVTSGERVPYWAELDQDATAGSDPLLFVRPAVNFGEGHRIVVGFRDLQTGDGTPIEATDVFRAYRDRLDSGVPEVEARRKSMEEVFAYLDRAGVEREELVVAWDFTVASAQSIAGPLLHMRDDAFRRLGDRAPSFTVDTVEEQPTDKNPTGNIARRVTGTFTVPSYLQGDGGPGSNLERDADGMPVTTGEFVADYICVIPSGVLRDEEPAATPVLYGHGLLGSHKEVNARNIGLMIEEHNAVYCATPWVGFADEDVIQAATALTDLSEFPAVADRSLQGMLDFLFLGRLMSSDAGFVSNAAFQSAAGEPVLDTDALVYDSNSQGAIMGLALNAVAQDWTRGVLGVPGMNYSTLLNRSTDFDTYKAILDPSYPDPEQRTLAIPIAQMLWDRFEGNGYAQHVTADPYPNTPKKRILLHVAFGDHQVANVAAEVEARTIGARLRSPELAEGRSADVEPHWGIDPIEEYPFAGSAIVYWDSGTPAPPSGNVPPRAGSDPHEDPRMAPAAREQKAAFFASGEIVDTCDGRPCAAEPAG